MNIEIPVSFGELIDKITILEIKSNNIKESTKLININKELVMLNDILDKLAIQHNINNFQTQLLEINLKLWNLENKIRDFEESKTFNEEFIEVARSIYHTNDQRSQIKKIINFKFGSSIIEEKSHKEK